MKAHDPCLRPGFVRDTMWHLRTFVWLPQDKRNGAFCMRTDSYLEPGDEPRSMGLCLAFGIRTIATHFAGVN